MIWNLLLVTLGGGLGTCLRYLVSDCVTRVAGGFSPAGTLAVNVAGCLLIGVVAAFIVADSSREGLRLFFIVGLLGGFTTFSAFGLETIHLVHQRQFVWAAANVVCTNAACLLAVWMTFRVTARSIDL